MIVETMTWGSLEVAEDHLYHFAKGIPGFDEETEFALIDKEDGLFVYLQSLKDKALAFLLVDPFVFYPSYEFELPEGDSEELELDAQVIVRCMVTLRSQVELSTINLLAPIVLNPVKRLGKQVVLHRVGYQTKHPLWTEQVHSAASGKAGE
ncbi:flagellar assembly protein FliW [Paenibacillus macerans]|uniref:flagellar assembly protein FliW n=1 Tax=Paenibacillus macerans TaxID=44252 RepID=UPI003D31C590